MRMDNKDEENLDISIKMLKSKKGIRYAVFGALAIFILGTYLFLPVHLMKASQMKIRYTATYRYGGKSIKTEDHADINRWMQNNRFGWKWL